MLRRLARHQPESFAFTPANQAWAEAQITKYPEGRQASAVIALMWRAHEQEGWLTRPAIEHIADRLGMARIRALEVATFYTMFQLHPVGSVANIQICGTLSCMITGAEDLIALCKARIAPEPLMLSADGKFTWQEVECLGACANAPMAQIGKDYYEDLTPESLGRILDTLAAGKVPRPGPQNGRYASEPAGGLTSLKAHDKGRMADNASVELALAQGDTVRRIDGSEAPLTAPWLGKDGLEKAGLGKSVGVARVAHVTPEAAKAAEPRPGKGFPASHKGATKQEAEVLPTGRPAPAGTIAVAAAGPGTVPARLAAPRGGKPDDLKRIKGVGPKLEAMLHGLGFFHYDQVAGWTAEEVAWVDANLQGFKGRVSRDDWQAQARILAAGGETEFSKRAKS